MKLEERILSILSRSPECEDYVSGTSEWKIENALSLLENEYPDFGALVSGKRVVDFGCGMGYQSVALALKYDCTVIGLNPHQSSLEQAKHLARSHSVPESKLLFVDELPDRMLNSFDVVISQNSFEHFGNPSMILAQMKSLLNDSGKLLITFGPPWLSPFGSHMSFFCRVPWINVLFTEETVMRIRSRYRSDGATRYQDVESGLNKMTIAKLERIVRSSNLRAEYQKYSCIKGLDLFARIPFLREFLIGHASVILSDAYQGLQPPG